MADTSYGPQKIVVVDPGDGNLRSIWLLHDALLSQMKKLKPQPGDVIAVRYLGRQQSGSGRSYHAYTVATDAEKPQFAWDAPAGKDRAELQWDSDDEAAEPNPFDDEPAY